MDKTTLILLSATDLATAAFPAPEAILAPILSRGSQCLLYGLPGLGKSLVALGIAHAAATGGSFLGWHAPRPHRVLYLDGYTAPAEMQRRLALFGTPPPSLQFSLAAGKPGEALDLSELESQARLMAGWRRPELVVLDDLTSLAGPHAATGRWNELERFLLLQRRFGRAVLLVHHADRDSQPPGSSQPEDVFDVVLAARRPPGWQALDGARVEIQSRRRALCLVTHSSRSKPSCATDAGTGTSPGRRNSNAAWRCSTQGAAPNKWAACPASRSRRTRRSRDRRVMTTWPWTCSAPRPRGSAS